MTMGYRRPHRTGLTVAATALVLAAGAAVTSGLALVRPVEPAQHTMGLLHEKVTVSVTRPDWPVVS